MYNSFTFLKSSWVEPIDMKLMRKPRWREWELMYSIVWSNNENSETVEAKRVIPYYSPISDLFCDDELNSIVCSVSFSVAYRKQTKFSSLTTSFTEDVLLNNVQKTYYGSICYHQKRADRTIEAPV